MDEKILERGPVLRMLNEAIIALQHAQRVCKWIDSFNVIKNSNLDEIGKSMFLEMKDEARVAIDKALKDLTDGS